MVTIETEYMSVPRGTETTMLSGRAQSTLIGIVLLIGMVAIGSLGIFLVASDMLTDVEQESEHDRVENSFVELSQQMETASSDDDVSRSMDIDAGEDGAVVMSNTGNLTIEGGDVNKTIPIGAIEYTGDDGTKIAYQAGGVFRETGNETRVVSAPPINYDADSEALSFPIIKTRDEAQLDSGNIHVSHHKTNPLQEASLVENDSVTIEVESEYYRGWEEFFRTEAGDTSIQNVDHNNQTVQVLVGYETIDGAFDEGVTIASDDPDHFHDHHENFDSHSTGTPLPEMDTVIEEIVDDARNGKDIDDNLSDGTYTNPLDDGTYFVNEINGDDDYEFNLTKGNATLIVENDVTLEDGGSINVTDRDANRENVLRVYAGGNHTLIDGNMCVDDGSCDADADVIQFYGPSTMSVDFGPGSTGAFEGVFYVASSEEKDWWDGGTGKCEDYQQFHMQGGGDFYGSLVAYSACAHSSSLSFDYDDDLKDTDIDPYYGDYTLPPQLTYLNVAEHKVDVEGN